MYSIIKKKLYFFFLMTISSHYCVCTIPNELCNISFNKYYVSLQSKTSLHSREEYNIHSAFQTLKSEFDHLKSLEIEQNYNIMWFSQENAAHFLLFTNYKDTLFCGKIFF